MVHPKITNDPKQVPADVEALLSEMEGAEPGYESDKMRLLLARVTLDNGFQFQGLCDVDGKIWEANHTALVGAGLVRSDIHGKPFWHARWWQSSEEAQRQLETGIRRAAKGEFVRYDAVIFGGEGGKQTIVIDFSIRPALDSQGQPRFLVVEGRDVTAQRQLEQAVEQQRQQLTEAVQRLEEADTLKSQMFANVSHELRTPLALILGPTQRLRHELGAEYEADLRLIEMNAQLVLKHVTDLLDAAKLESYAMDVRYICGDLATWLRDWANLFSGVAAQRRVQLTIAGESLELDCDVEHLRRIVTNLLSNAIKFTPVGGTIELSFRGEGGRIVITVDDSGPGITPENREKAFERFRQLDGGATRQVGGTGLGLSICRQLVTLLDGRIWIESSPLGGARFVVDLPKQAPEGVTVGATIRRETGIATASAIDAAMVAETVNHEIVIERRNHPGAGHIVICEDHPQLLAFLAEVLGDRYSVVAVMNGSAGLERIRQHPPDVIVTDIMMPVMSGDELIAELQRDETLSRIPVLVLSARADDEMRERLLENGARDYVSKPFGRAELLARVANLMTMKRSVDELEKVIDDKANDLLALASAARARLASAK